VSRIAFDVGRGADRRERAVSFLESDVMWLAGRRERAGPRAGAPNGGTAPLSAL